MAMTGAEKSRRHYLKDPEIFERLLAYVKGEI
jgi:hypothetical protein